MRPLKKQKYRFDVKKINVDSRNIKKDKDLTPHELFDEIIRAKSKRRHR
jgi:hypothetical protein